MYHFIFILDFVLLRMMTRKGSIVVAMVAILALTAAMPMASASNITTVVSPSTHSANVTAYVNTTATLKTNNSLVLDIAAFLANLTDKNTSIVLKSNSTIFVALQNAIQNRSSSAKLSYLSIDASRTSAKVSSQELIINHTMKIVMNVTNILENGSLNLAWRGFQDNQSVMIDKVNYNQFQVDNMSGTARSSLDFHAFSEPLSNWTRQYNEITNRTTFTMDAGFTLNYSYNGTINNGKFVNVTVQSDPSYTIVTPGYAVANSNSLTYTNPPSSGLNHIVIYVVAVVIIVVGVGVAVAARRRRS